ncbi:transmembrane protein 205 isoform X2 [Lingula anatina]|uniref:Transmembrane protein 205 isoform X2 n=1 Tax=Lingula anatina TaxID=7574 RepID=A0A1S3KEN0_LINAN|nr:transmembrane protein 205 isoform X2 [Lingula anatina]|eukprot:XP_013420701.1 transmembrane protein 205 isoform X2 [Lingula anatina]
MAVDRAWLVLVTCLVTCVSVAFGGDGEEPSPPGTFIKFVHLTAISSHFGMQVWVSFVSGVLLLKSTSRHTFGHVQSYMFPAYFGLGSALEAVALATFVYAHNSWIWEWSVKVQASALVVSLFCSLAELVYVVPMNVDIMTRMYKIERDNDIGSVGVATSPEVRGQISELMARDVNYAGTYRRFFKWHGVSSLLNMTGIAANLIYLFYMTSKLQSL